MLNKLFKYGDKTCKVIAANKDNTFSIELYKAFNNKGSIIVNKVPRKFLKEMNET
jgi:hypothetical protein